MRRLRCLVLACAAALAAAPAAAAPPAVFDLGPNRLAQNVSDDGTVVVGLSVALDGVGTEGVFRWTPATGVRVIGGLVAGRPDVSADGSVVAATVQTGDRAQAGFWTAAGGWKPLEAFELIPPLPGWHTSANAISGNGQRLAGTTTPPPVDFGYVRAFSFNPDTWTDRWADFGWAELPLPRKGSFAEALATSDDGTVQAGRATEPGGAYRAVRWRDGVLQQLRDAEGLRLGGESVVCNRDCSVIAGGGGGSSAVRPVLAWRLRSGMRAPACYLQPLEGPRLLALRYYAYAISDDGNVIAGAYYYDSPEEMRNIARGFLWIGDVQGGTMHDLQQYLADAGQPALNGWQDLVPTGLSGGGRHLVGWGYDAQGALRGWRLDFGARPVPRPGLGKPGPGPIATYTRCPALGTGRPVARAAAAATDSAPERSPDGVFRSSDGRSYLVRSRGGALYGGARADRLTRLVPLGADRYYDPAARALRSFVRDRTGAVQGMRLGAGRTAPPPWRRQGD